MDRLAELMVELLNYQKYDEDLGITTDGFYVTEYGNLGYVLRGFGKSDTAKLEYDPEKGEITCFTRYGQKDQICDLEDLILVHAGWVRSAYETGFYS